MENLLQKITALQAEIKALRPLDKDTQGRIMQKFRLDWNYHSNAIEGNSLDFGETKTFLLHGITAAGKPLKDHLDLRGHNEAILALDDIIKEERPITEAFIRDLYKIILVEDSYNPAVIESGAPTRKKVHVGQYKTTNNHVKTATGEIFYFASVEETPAKMHDLIEWLRAQKEEENPVILAALFHYKFIRIHPFDDGNGRLARILMNFILMRAGFPPVVIKTTEKEDYFRALRQADGGDLGAFVQYVAEQLVYSLELYWKGAKGESIEELDDVEKEFALFKMEQKGIEKVVYLTINNRLNIIEKEVVPFVTIIFDKIKQIDDLFDNRIDSIDYMIELINDEVGYATHLMKDMALRDAPDLGNTIHENVESKAQWYRIFFEWKSYNRPTNNKQNTDYTAQFFLELPLRKNNYWTIKHVTTTVKEAELVKIYYGNPDFDKAKQLGNQVLKDFMQFIKE